MHPFLAMQDVSKTFPGVRALDKVDLEVRLGEVHALAGENGAGKSTLMKIMTGVYKADAGGRILIEGLPVEIADAVHARSLGISIIYQELSMVENLTVAENIFLAKEPLRASGFLDKARMNREAGEVLATLHMDVDPTTPVAELSIGQKQMIEIAKAISYRSKIIIMDEADRLLESPRGRHADEPHPQAAPPGNRHRLHHASPRRDLRDRRPRHDPARTAAPWIRCRSRR